MLWKVDSQTVKVVQPRTFSNEQIQEKELEGWIEDNPDMLGEGLLIIGRQVNVAGVNDRLDLLALDSLGNTVIVEIKRGKLSDPVDIQAIRYASYISRWTKRKIEELAESYWAQRLPEEENQTFEETFAAFSSDIETEDQPSLNERQRIIIVGEATRKRLGSVALWLREQGIDIKIVEITPHRDSADGTLILSTQIIIPPPSTEEFEIGGSDEGATPWIIDGKSWHLDKRCRKQSRELLLTLVDQIETRFDDAEGPNWAQKIYLSFRLRSANWLSIVTGAHLLRLDTPVVTGKWNANDLAKCLGIAVFSEGDTLSEKFATPTSVRIIRNKGGDIVRFTIKDDALLKSEEFWAVLKETHDDFINGG